jgi:serine/threonine protein kinase
VDIGIYDTRIDNWSLGVILYVMISGKFPFSGKNRKDTFWSKMNTVLSFCHKPFRSASTEVKELIAGLLMRNPNDRYLALEVMHHPWVLNKEAREEFIIPVEVIRSMHNYAYTNDLKKWVSYMVSLIIEEKHVIKIKQMFINYDKDHNGFIDRKEFLNSRLSIESSILLIPGRTGTATE